VAVMFVRTVRICVIISNKNWFFNIYSESQTEAGIYVS
jgi:hypothetical protein